MKTSKINLLSPLECKAMCEYFEEEKEKFKISTENGEAYISAYESNLEKDFNDVHQFLEEKITKKILCSLPYKFYSISVKKSFGCRYTTTPSPSMPFHYDGDDLTILIYLNDDFEGGGTSFPLIKKVFNVDDVGVGNAIIFPGLNIKSWHAALPITEGTRYTISVRLIKNNIFYKLINILRIFILMPLTFLFNKYPTLYTK